MVNNSMINHYRLNHRIVCQLDVADMVNCHFIESGVRIAGSNYALGDDVMRFGSKPVKGDNFGLRY